MRRTGSTLRHSSSELPNIQVIMNFGMQCLYATVETLRIAGVIRYILHRKSQSPQMRRAASRGEQFHTKGVQTACEFLQT